MPDVNPFHMRVKLSVKSSAHFPGKPRHETLLAANEQWLPSGNARTLNSAKSLAFEQVSELKFELAKRYMSQKGSRRQLAWRLQGAMGRESCDRSSHPKFDVSESSRSRRKGWSSAHRNTVPTLHRCPEGASPSDKRHLPRSTAYDHVLSDLLNGPGDGCPVDGSNRSEVGRSSRGNAPTRRSSRAFHDESEYADMRSRRSAIQGVKRKEESEIFRELVARVEHDRREWRADMKMMRLPETKIKSRQACFEPGPSGDMEHGSRTQKYAAAVTQAASYRCETDTPAPSGSHISIRTAQSTRSKFESRAERFGTPIRNTEANKPTLDAGAMTENTEAGASSTKDPRQMVPNVPGESLAKLAARAQRFGTRSPAHNFAQSVKTVTSKGREFGLFFQRSKRNGGDAFPPSKADDGCTRDQRTSPSSPTAGYEVNDRRVSKRSRNDRMDSCLTLKGRRRSTWDGGKIREHRVSFYCYLVTSENGMQVCHPELEGHGLTSSSRSGSQTKYATETKSASECFRAVRESMKLSRQAAIAEGAAAEAEAAVFEEGKKRTAEPSAQQMSKRRKGLS